MVRETLDNKSYSSFSSYYFDVEATMLCMLLPTLSTSYVLCAIFITNLLEHYFRHNGEVWTQNLFRIIKPFFIFLSARYLSLSFPVFQFLSLTISLSYSLSLTISLSSSLSKYLFLIQCATCSLLSWYYFKFVSLLYHFVLLPGYKSPYWP